ncbi:corticotropin releasing hormone b [Stigmatopora argus]
MKLHFLATIIAILLVGFLSLGTPAAGAPQQSPHAPPQEPHRRSGGPIMERLGEEYFIRLGNGDARALPPSSMYPLGVAGGLLKLNRALQRLRLTRRLRHDGDGGDDDDSASAERGRRSEEPPISLDLTFHLLREMMEMSKAEQLAQQAQNNRRMMELFGK